MTELVDRDTALYDAPLDLDCHRKGRIIIYSVDGDLYIQTHTEEGIVERMKQKENLNKWSLKELENDQRQVLIPKDGKVYAVADKKRDVKLTTEEETESVEAKFLKECPTFMGTNLIEYGGFSKQKKYQKHEKEMRRF